MSDRLARPGETTDTATPSSSKLALAQLKTRYNRLSLLLGVPGVLLHTLGTVLIENPNISAEAGLPTLLSGIALVITGLGFYAKSKGQSALHGLWGFGGLLGLIAVAALPDKFDQNPSKQSTKRRSGLSLVGILTVSGVFIVAALVVFMVGRGAVQRRAEEQAGIGKTEQWRLYGNPGAGYQIEFPAPNRWHYPVGRLVKFHFMDAELADGQLFKTGHTVFPPAIEFDSDVGFKAAMEIPTQESAGTITSQRDIKFSGRPARDFTWTGTRDGDPITGLGRVVIVGRRVFVAMWSAPLETTTGNVDRFFNSFRITYRSN